MPPWLNIIPGLGIFIPTGRAINPITNTNWEGVGVEPDIKVDSDKALETALPEVREAALAYRKSADEKINKQIDDIYGAIEKAKNLFRENKNVEAEMLVASALENGLKNQILDEILINQLRYENMGGGNLDAAIAIFEFNLLISWTGYVLFTIGIICCMILVFKKEIIRKILSPLFKIFVPKN